MAKLVIKFLRNKYSSVYDIVVINKGGRKKGRFIEKLGYFLLSSNRTGSKEYFINFLKLGYWLNRGAILQKSISKCFFGLK